jgi:hypothetical protein
LPFEPLPPNESSMPGSGPGEVSTAG